MEYGKKGRLKIGMIKFYNSSGTIRASKRYVGTDARKIFIRECEEMVKADKAGGYYFSIVPEV